MKIKKQFSLPLALLLFAVVMAFYGYRTNGNRLPEGFYVFVIVEVAVIVGLFLVLRWKERHFHGKDHN